MPTDPVERARWIREQAALAGFDLCGIAAVPPAHEAYTGPTPSTAQDALPSEWNRLPEWLARGYAGEMNYLRDPRRADPNLVLPGVRSLIVVALNYNSDRPYSTERHATAPDDRDAPRGWISRYAWGDDYHLILSRKLDALVAAMRTRFENSFEARFYVDTGPLPERVAAKYAGMGWLAKNTCLINQKLGSWLFLGVILTTLELETSLAPGSQPPRDLCGTCTRCLDACPTGAFPAPYVLDASRCISYLTIELRGAIPEQFRPAMGDAVFGCDICQDVCPWNRRAPIAGLAAFDPRQRNQNLSTPRDRDPTESGDSLFAPRLEWMASLSQEEFSAQFRRSAVKRAKWRGLVRNACVALGNSQPVPGSDAHGRIVALLRRLSSSPDALIAEHARWALDRIGGGISAHASSNVSSALNDPQ